MMSALKKLHKWVGLITGLQVLLWLSSGLVISLLDPARVSGGEWMNKGGVDERPLPSGPLLEPGQLAESLLEGALAVNLSVIRGQAVYRLKYEAGEKLVDATDGSIIEIGLAEAQELALQDFGGEGSVISVTTGKAPDLETRNHSGPYWKVLFSDGANTAIYISASTGDVLERRNKYWRVRDFFWMLHIMDYEAREDFNNALVITIALIAVWLGLSGFILLFGSFGRHDFFFLNLSGRRQQSLVTLVDPTLPEPQTISLRKGSNLFLSLATHDIHVPSICGGGGECGKCRIKFESDKPPRLNSVEEGLVPKPLRQKGYRLACQHEVEDDMILLLPAGTLSNGS